MLMVPPTMMRIFINWPNLHCLPPRLLHRLLWDLDPDPRTHADNNSLLYRNTNAGARMSQS